MNKADQDLLWKVVNKFRDGSKRNPENFTDMTELEFLIHVQQEAIDEVYYLEGLINKLNENIRHKM